jgi:hypothetical protein
MTSSELFRRLKIEAPLTTRATSATKTTMSAHFFLNRNAEKTSHDRMYVDKKDGNVQVYYIDYYEPAKKGIRTTYSVIDFYQYMNNLLDFLQLDADNEPYDSMDVMIPGYPVVCMDFRDNQVRELLLRTLYCWLLTA